MKGQTLLGVPLSDATQWELIETVGDSGHVVFGHLECLAAQGELIVQDDTSVRILSLLKENQGFEARAEALGLSRSLERTGIHHGTGGESRRTDHLFILLGSLACRREPGIALKTAPGWAR